MENTIDAQTKVFELGEAYWAKLSQWLRTHKIATATEMRALTPATQISNGMFPDDRQCKTLLNLREKVISEGFPEQLK